MENQPREQRLKQLNMWVKSHKEAIEFLEPLAKLFNNFNENHIMYIPYSGQIEEYLKKAIKEQKERLNSSLKELESDTADND